MTDKYINIYTNNGTAPNLGTFKAKREWLEGTNGYQCPPMTLANTLGWYFAMEESIVVNWNGSYNPGSIKITYEATGEPVNYTVASSNFEGGVLTLTPFERPHFETPPGYSLLIFPAPNMWIDGIVPLSGIVETDWSSWPFPSNWKVTTPNKDIVIPKGYPILTFIPINIEELSSFKLNIMNVNDWEKKDHLETFKKNRIPVKDRAENYVDETSGAYLRGMDLSLTKIKDRMKVFSLHKGEKK